MTKTIFELAAAAVAERRESYGPPDQHWQRSVDLLNAAFTERVRDRLAAGEPMFVIEDWPLIMALDKISRELGVAMRRDNSVDVAGYLHGRDEILMERERAAMPVRVLVSPRRCPECGERSHNSHVWPLNPGDGERYFQCPGWQEEPIEPCEDRFITDAGDEVRCDGFAGHEGSHTGEYDGGFISW